MSKNTATLTFLVKGKPPVSYRIAKLGDIDGVHEVGRLKDDKELDQGLLGLGLNDARGKCMSSATSAEIAARLDRLPSSRTVWTIVLLISLGGVFEFYDLFFTAYVAPGMVKTGMFTQASLGFFASLKDIRVAGFGTFVFSTFAGLWLGVVALGRVADRYGRKAVFTWSLAWYAVCTGIMAFQQSGEWLNIWRLIAGIGFGVQLVTVDTYISELMPRRVGGAPHLHLDYPISDGRF